MLPLPLTIGGGIILEKNDSLNNTTRNDIYNLILNNPGLHLNQITKKMKISKSTINYHINYLKKQGFILFENDGKYLRYYVPKKVNKFEKKVLKLLRQQIPFQIVIYLIQNSNISQIEISKYLEKHPTTISYHLKKLKGLDIIERIPNGKKTNYKLKNPQYIYDIIHKYAESFWI